MRYTSVIIAFVISLLCQNGMGRDIISSPLDIFNTAKNITTGAISMIPGAIPTPKELFEGGKQLIAGYPLEAVTSAINTFCSAALATDSIQPRITPDIHNMSFLLMTPNKNYTYRLLDADDMWKSPAFDKNKNTVILITGWTTDLEDANEGIATVSKAYFCRGDSNFVVVDSARYVDTLYTWSALNTEAIGESIAKGLVELVKYVPLEKIHLIGHSLGAHIAGAAGRTFNYITKTEISRITGLDPAKPCFNEGEALSGLQRGDAEFIDVIHSNPGVLGKRDPMGTVDFYPGGLAPLPVGCYSISCAHGRAWQYYAETVYPGNERNFLAVKCNSISKLRDNKCPGDAYPMGYDVPKTLKGNYFLEVNGESPFGKNANKNNAPVKCN